MKNNSNFLCTSKNLCTLVSVFLLPQEKDIFQKSQETQECTLFLFLLFLFFAFPFKNSEEGLCEEC